MSEQDMYVSPWGIGVTIAAVAGLGFCIGMALSSNMARGSQLDAMSKKRAACLDEMGKADVKPTRAVAVCP